MASIVFWILFWLLCAVLFISTLIRQHDKDKRRLEKIRQSFGVRDTEPADSAVFDEPMLITQYFRKKRPADQYIDDITAHDLGLRDIYSRIDRCMTSAGEACLCVLLRLLPFDPDVSNQRYDRISSYINDKDKAADHAYILAGYGKHHDIDEFGLITALSHAGCRNVITDLSMIFLITAGIIISLFYPAAGITITVVALIVSVITYFSGKRVMDENLKGLAMCLKLIDCARRLDKSGCEGFERYRDLYPLLRARWLIPYKESTSSSPLDILYDYIRMIIHTDLIAYSLKIEKISALSDRIADLYADVGMTDCCISIASYIIARDHCRAQFTGDTVLSARGMYHPLVENAVCNDIDAKRGVLITGSNASGKSTFLKAVGVNEIFAACFGFAFAKEFVSANFSVYTSMALTDDLLARESYYTAEARSIKRICDAAGKGKCLCIIDEILKGTNTTERIAASTQVLKYLCSLNILCFAATHDRELTLLLKDDMDQYHFTEEIRDDTVTFPFVIQKGVADKTNAITILSMLGFDKGIVSSAESLADTYRKTGKWEIRG